MATGLLIFRDFLIFSKMRYLVYIVVVGLFAGLIKLREQRQIQIKSSELRLQLQKAKMKEIELKMNPEIIYPNLAFIKENAPVKPEEASQMVVLMAGLLRKLVDTLEEDRLRLSDEIDLFKLYTDLCRLKLQRFIDTEINFDSADLGRRVPSFILMVPLLEELLFGRYASFSEALTGLGFNARSDSDSQFVISLELLGIKNSPELKELLKDEPLLAKSNSLLNKLEYDEVYDLTPKFSSDKVSMEMSVSLKREVEYA